MLKKITEIFFQCEICYEKYSSETDAAECEKRGIAVPEFFERMVVTKKIKGGKSIKGIIYEEYIDNDINNPDRHHQAPAYYEIFILDPQAKNKDWLTISKVYLRDHLTLIENFDGKKCPLCDKNKISTVTKENYRPFCYPQFFIKRVEISECNNCHSYFFNAQQLQKAKRLVRKGIKKHYGQCKIADTVKLIKNNELYYS